MSRHLNIKCDKCHKDSIHKSYWTSISINRMLPEDGGIVCGKTNWEFTFCIECKNDIENKIFNIFKG